MVEDDDTARIDVLGHDPGRTAMWICGALLGLLQSKGVISDPEILGLSKSLENSASAEREQAAIDMRRAAEWLRHSVSAAND